MTSVTYIVHEYPPVTQTFVAREIEALATMGVNVDVFSVTSPPGVGSTDPKVRVLAGGGPLAHPVNRLRSALKAVRLGAPLTVAVLKRSSGARQLLRQIRGVVLAVHVDSLDRGRTRHVHAHFLGLCYDIACYYRILNPGTRVSVTGHAGDVMNTSSSQLQALLTPSDIVACASQAVMDDLLRKVPDQAAQLVHCGLPAGSFAAGEPGVTEFNWELVSVGRLIAKKGHALLIEAVAHCREQGFPARLTIVGSGPLEADLRKLVASRGLDPHVTLTGTQPPAAIEGILQSSDLFVLACVQDAQGDLDGIPVALMEALAAAVPVLSTRVGGITELVMAGRTGYICSDMSPCGLAKCLIEISLDHEGRQRMSSAGLELVRQHFSSSIEAAKMLTLFHKSERS